MVESICGRRSLILRCDAAKLPKLYTDVIDRRLNPVGKLTDVFGNIRAPYAVVICTGACKFKHGEKLFAR